MSSVYLWLGVRSFDYRTGRQRHVHDTHFALELVLDLFVFKGDEMYLHHRSAIRPNM